MHIQKPIKIQCQVTLIELVPCPYILLRNICLVYMKSFVRFDEIHSRTHQDIKEICTYNSH